MSDEAMLMLMRSVRSGGNLYLRREDVLMLIRAIAATEDEESRERLEFVAESIEKLKGPS